ncbi:MAG: M1 family aminopeptidase, partial [Anaerolineae bacterium]
MQKSIFIITLLLLALTTGVALAQAPEGKEYVVQAGDSLSAIAKKEYGNSQAFPTIVEATNVKAAEDSSFAVIKDAKVILVGQKLWLPATAESVAPAQAAPAASANGLGDTYYPLEGNPGYDVQHYTIELAVDVETNTIEGSTTIEALATSDLPTFNLDFMGLEISAVSVDGSEAEFSRNGQELTITPAAPIAAKASFTVNVAYNGVPEPNPDPALAIVPALNGWRSWGKGIVGAANQPDGAMTWFPSNNHPTDKATFTFRITADDPNVAVASGILQKVVPAGDNTNTYVWEMDAPMATQIAFVMVGNFERVESVAPNGVPLRYYFPPGTDQADIKAFEVTGEMMVYLEDLLGPYPFDAYGAIIIPDYIGDSALETQSLATFDDYGPKAIPEDAVMHELFHQWYGNTLTLADWGDLWLHEGFAKYSEVLWYQHTGRLDEANAILTAAYNRQLAVAGMPEEMTGNPPLEAGKVYPAVDHGVRITFLVSYDAGVLAVHNLRMTVGDEAFFDILRTFYEENKNTPVTTEDFIATAEKVTGRDLSDWADVWVYGTTIPADFPLLTPAQAANGLGDAYFPQEGYPGLDAQH